jgi:hypothetical protein
VRERAGGEVGTGETVEPVEPVGMTGMETRRRPRMVGQLRYAESWASWRVPKMRRKMVSSSPTATVLCDRDKEMER